MESTNKNKQVKKYKYVEYKPKPHIKIFNSLRESISNILID